MFSSLIWGRRCIALPHSAGQISAEHSCKTTLERGRTGQPEQFGDERMRGGNFKDVVNYLLLLLRSQDKPRVVLECLVKEWTHLWRVFRPASQSFPNKVLDREFAMGVLLLLHQRPLKSHSSIVKPVQLCSLASHSDLYLRNATTAAATSSPPICSAPR